MTKPKQNDRFYIYFAKQSTAHPVEIRRAQDQEAADIIYRGGYMTHPYKVTATGKNYSHIDSAIVALQSHQRAAENTLAATTGQTENDEPAPTGEDCGPYIRELLGELDRLFNVNQQRKPV